MLRTGSAQAENLSDTRHKEILRRKAPQNDMCPICNDRLPLKFARPLSLLVAL